MPLSKYYFCKYNIQFLLQLLCQSDVDTSVMIVIFELVVYDIDVFGTSSV